jgi:hypothetical protein
MVTRLQPRLAPGRAPAVCAQRPLLRPRPLRRWTKISASAAAGAIAVGTDGLPLPIPGTVASSRGSLLQRFVRWWDVGWRQNEALPPPDKVSNLLRKVGELVRPDKKLVGIACVFMVSAQEGRAHCVPRPARARRKVHAADRSAPQRRPAPHGAKRGAAARAGS